MKNRKRRSKPDKLRARRKQRDRESIQDWCCEIIFGKPTESGYIEKRLDPITGEWVVIREERRDPITGEVTVVWDEDVARLA
jgi:hypothetical protein